MAITESQQKEFINKIAPLVQRYAPQYGILVCSPIIAQAVLESNYGTSNKVYTVKNDGTIGWRHNYFGLKWRNNRCAISNDYFEEWTSEQNPDGSYTNIVSKFCKFKSLEDCVIGYFQWTNTSNYANLKGVTDPETYLNNIKADKYATSKDYVENLMKVINKWNLTQYDSIGDNKEGVTMSTIIVGIDAGHGSNTAGKRTVDGYKEHWINVKTAYYCEQMLLANGVKVVRVAWDDTISTDDEDISLSKRQSIIKEAKCDYSISLHANAHGNGLIWTNANGAETLVHNNPNLRGKESLSLANSVQKRLIQGTAQKDRGVKYQSLAMCNCSAMGTKGSVLVEIGFMTNQHEANLMKTDAFCKEQGEDCAKGILDYLGIAIKNTPVPNNTDKVNNSPNKVSTKIYTVVSGDTLSKIGAKTGVDWKKIAELNGIKFPYVIKRGQVLIISESANVSSTPMNFRVKLKSDMTIRKTPEVTPTNVVKKNGAKKGTVYTIVDTNGDWGLLKSYAAGRNGWININSKYADRV